MRLLNVHTLTLEEFLDGSIPGYAILSHRWSNEEVTFQQMEAGQAPHGLGLSKIKGFCHMAKGGGRSWVWVDTCCIDKKSSAELSEAINSMYGWYEQASACYVYLSDVECTRNAEGEPDASSLLAFRQSSWFTRGWTLQELLAPNIVFFFDKNWTSLGSRTDLSKEIAVAAGIKEEKLGSKEGQRESCVAEKMNWASKRKTSRIEDQAYCLLGLFDLNMPLLYGEGRKAFKRLQEEIIRSSADESIFAWGIYDSYYTDHPYLFPMSSKPKQDFFLAPSPQVFKSCDRLNLKYISPRRNEYTLTNRGLKLAVNDSEIIVFKPPQYRELMTRAIESAFDRKKLFTTSASNIGSRQVILVPLRCRLPRIRTTEDGVVASTPAVILTRTVYPYSAPWTRCGIVVLRDFAHRSDDSESFHLFVNL